MKKNTIRKTPKNKTKTSRKVTKGTTPRIGKVTGLIFRSPTTKMVWTKLTGIVTPTQLAVKTNQTRGYVNGLLTGWLNRGYVKRVSVGHYTKIAA